jgi:hypothetical protein
MPIVLHRRDCWYSAGAALKGLKAEGSWSALRRSESA